MSNLADLVNKIKKKNVFIAVNFPSMDEISAKHSIFVRRFEVDPEYIVIDPDIWLMLKSQANALTFITCDENFEYLLGMKVVIIINSDTLILPEDEKLQRALNRRE